MENAGYTLFETGIGPCGLAWSAHGVIGVQLPENTPGATRARLAARFPVLEERAPSAHAKQACTAIARHFGGSPDTLTDIALDLAGVTPFRRRVYDAARTIRPGETLSYGELAARLGQPGAARAIGQAMGSNPCPIVIPCHRVLAADGRGGGFSAAGGSTVKACMLHLEGLRDVRYPGFDYDLMAALEQLRRIDRRLARIIDRVGPPKMELLHTASVFVALTRAIVYQQLSGKAAATIYGRVCALLPRGERDLDAANLLALAPAALRGAGLSHNKVLALRDLAERAQAGEIPELAALRRMDDESIVASLTRVRGIGRWTVEMLLMFRLGRPDVMAIDDLGLRQGHALILGKQGETARAALAAYAERWRPYRSLAAWYLWRAVELARED